MNGLMNKIIKMGDSIIGDCYLMFSIRLFEYYKNNFFEYSDNGFEENALDSIKLAIDTGKFLLDYKEKLKKDYAWYVWDCIQFMNISSVYLEEEIKNTQKYYKFGKNKLGF